MLLINEQVSRLCKAFENGSLANMKLSKTQLHKIAQSGGFLGRLLGPLLKTRFPLIGNVLKPLAKIFLIPLGLTAATSATHAAIHKKLCQSGTRPSGLAKRAILIISNEEINDIMKIVKSLEEFGLLKKAFVKQSKMQQKEKRRVVTRNFRCWFMRRSINRSRHNWS